MGKILRKIVRPEWVMGLVGWVARKSDSRSALEYLFAVDRLLYDIEGKTSVRYGRGVHSKHRHIKYHDFFIENIPDGKRVLDIGCGNGVLDRAMVQALPSVHITGIELNRDNYIWAKKKSAHPNITYVNADALRYEAEGHFDVVVMSNVLEHIERRSEFLRKVCARYHPDYFLIRVPMFERDWRIPLQEELGIDYFLDSTHHVEYRFDQLESELADAGLRIVKMQTNWGEYWLKAVPV